MRETSEHSSAKGDLQGPTTKAALPMREATSAIGWPAKVTSNGAASAAKASEGQPQKTTQDVAPHEPPAATKQPAALRAG